MSLLEARNPTLLDFAKRMDPNDKVARIIEILNTTNEVLDDMTWKEGNLIDGEKATMRTGIPDPTWRRFNEYVQPVKSSTAQVKFGCGMLENYSNVDKALADLNGNTSAFRLSEDKAVFEGFNQEIAETLFLGNETTAPSEFTGLAPYYNDPSANNGDNIIDGGAAGGQTDITSVWLVCWSDETVHGIIPKGSKAGLQHTDKGLVTLQTSSGFQEAYQSHYRWDAGLAVKDWRYAVRIANIDKSTTLATAATGANLPDLMFEALERIPSLSRGRCAFYMSRLMRTRLRQQLSATVKNGTLTFENVGGRRTGFFQEVPVRRVDVLSADESLLTFP